jgi:hypothetical protein
MEDLSTNLTPAETPQLSTQLNDPDRADVGQPTKVEAPEPKPEPKRPATRIDAIDRAMADVEKANKAAEPVAEADAKTAPEVEAAKPKPEPESQDGEPTTDQASEAREADAEQRAEKVRQANGDEIKPPPYMSDDSKKRWSNVPHAVRRDFEKREAQVAEVTKRYDRLRDFDELATSNGRDLRDSLATVHRFENMMRANPIAALNMALQESGPRKADGSPLSIEDVAHHIVSLGPQGYQQAMTQAQQQMRAQEQQQQTAQQQAMSVKAQAEEQALQRFVIDPFIASHPRYSEMEGTIAYFLQHGNLEPSLDEIGKLQAAYDMAERVHGASSQSSRSDRQPPASPDRVDLSSDLGRADPDFSGSRSVKGAPASGVDVSNRRRGKMSRTEAIDAALADLGFQ